MTANWRIRKRAENADRKNTQTHARRSKPVDTGNGAEKPSKPTSLSQGWVSNVQLQNPGGCIVAQRPTACLHACIFNATRGLRHVVYLLHVAVCDRGILYSKVLRRMRPQLGPENACASFSNHTTKQHNRSPYMRPHPFTCLTRTTTQGAPTQPTHLQLTHGSTHIHTYPTP